jgi:hypothetical protein
VVIYLRPLLIITSRKKKKAIETEQITLKALKSLDLRQQLLFVESYLPDAWEYLNDTNGAQLPKFDDNDEWITEGDNHATSDD